MSSSTLSSANRRADFSKKSRPKAKSRASQRRRLLLEALENRHLLSVTFLDTEDNDTLETAQVISHPGLIGVVDSMMPAISPGSVTSGDPDYFQFQAAVPGELHLSVSFVGGDQVTIQLYQQDGTLIGAPVHLAPTSPTVTITAPNTDDIFKVGIVGDAQYRLRVWNPDAQDLGAGHNNTRATATDLGNLETVPIVSENLTITNSDRDYFQFQLAEAGLVEVRAVMPETTGSQAQMTNLGIRIRDEWGEILASSNNTQGNIDVASFEASSGVTYFIEIYSGSVGQVNNYDLEIYSTPLPVVDISGWVFNDFNGNGFLDEGEIGLQGWRVYSDMDPAAVTDANGYYSFSAPLGFHWIEVVPPAGQEGLWFQSHPDEDDFGGYAIWTWQDMILDHIDFGWYQLDFSDAPDPSYPTLLANDGARHIIGPGPSLGQLIDAEADGQPDATATGDDLAGLDDEDGVIIPAVLYPGQPAPITVVVGGGGFGGYVDAWIDFNANDVWEPGEQIQAGFLTTGTHQIAVSVPADAAVDTTYVRFRISSQGSLDPHGLALDGEVEDYAVQIGRPGLELQKLTNGEDADQPTGPYLLVGDPVTWEYVVTNTGSVELVDVVVTDDQLGTVGTIALLAPGASQTLIATGTAVAGQYANLGTVTAMPPVGPEVTASDPSHYFGAEPSVRIEKATNGEDADDPTGPYLLVGDTVTWTYVVTNTGNVELTDVVVTDDVLGTVGTIASLAVGASETLTMTGTAAAGQYANLGAVIATPPVGPEVTASDPSHYFGAEPSITIEKATNGQDADDPTGPYILVGDEVTWTYVVTNTGNVALTDVVVTDDMLGTVGTISSLAVGASETLTMTGTAAEGQYGNVGTATGTPPVGQAVSASDPSHYFGAEPSIDIQKATNGEDADDPTGPYLLVGDTVTWTYVVTNTGNVELTDVVVTDDVLGTVGTIASLAVGASETLTMTGTATEGQYGNVGTATGTPPVGQDVSASDPSHYFGAEPSIDIQKATNGEDADDPTGPEIPVGDPVTWTYTVTNTGNVDLTCVGLSDDNGTPGDPNDDFTPVYSDGDGNGDGVLNPGETWIFAASGVAMEGQYKNTAIVRAEDPLGNQIEEQAVSHYLGYHPPGITGYKVTPWESKLEGWTIELYAGPDFHPYGPFLTGTDPGLLDTLNLSRPNGDPIRTTTTDASGRYTFFDTGDAPLPAGTYFVREVVPQGWRQTSPAAGYYTVEYDGENQFAGHDFENTTCFADAAGDLYEVADGTTVVTAVRAGILTIELFPGTMTVTKVGGGSFQYFDGSALMSTTMVDGRASEFNAAHQRVDLLAEAGDQFEVMVADGGGNATLRVLNAVHVVGGRLLITGSECGETVVVLDDGKRIMVGSTLGAIGGDENMTFEGIQYNALIMEAIYATTITFVEVNAGGGDDIVRIGDGRSVTVDGQQVTLGTVSSQSLIRGGGGDDAVRAGGARMTAYGDGDDDFIVGGNADEILYGNDGNDLLYGFAGSNRMDGGRDNDLLLGGAGWDPLLRGGAGDDIVSGGPGRNRLYGDTGIDTAYTRGIDLTISGFAQVHVVDENTDPVDQFFRGLLERYWNDQDDQYADTVDELIASLLL